MAVMPGDFMAVIGEYFMAVIPAKAGIHVALMQNVKMGPRFRGNDGLGVMLGLKARFNLVK